MSLESVTARIGEIQSRIAELSEPSITPLTPVNRPVTPAASRSAIGADAAKPFDVALAEATGAATLRPAGTLAPKLEALISKYGAQYSVDPNLIRAVIIAESDGDAKCTSVKGAKGLMQIMPDELKEYGISDPFDPEQNISAGTRQLAAKLKKYNNDLPLTLSAYNAGPEKVRIYNGVPPYGETRKYIDKVLGLMGKR